MANATKTVNSPYRVSKDVTWKENRWNFSLHNKKIKIFIALTLLCSIFLGGYFFFKKEEVKLEPMVITEPLKKKTSQRVFNFCEELKKIHYNSPTNVSAQSLMSCAKVEKQALSRKP